MAHYSCAACGLAVIVIEGETPIRACEHDAPIIAACVASLAGAGGVKVK